MKDETELLIRLFEEYRSQARHSEDQRVALSNIILIIASAAIGVIAQRTLVIEVLPLTILLIIVGIYGALASEKHYELYRYNTDVAAEYRKKINELNPQAKISELRNSAEEKNSKEFSWLHKIHLQQLWLFLHLSIAISGVIMTLVLVISLR